MGGEQFARLWEIINYICCYLTVNLGRGVFFSFALLLIVMVLRRMPFFENCFRRIILWGLFLWLPFIGGLKFFYETKFGVRGFLWWANWNYEHCLVGRIYFAVMILYGGFLLYRRVKLWRFTAGLKRLEGNIYVCEDMVTPFAAGLFVPKIVVPETFVGECAREDLETILFHEKVHIRLGHLWCLFFWNVLRVLLWPNVFLALSTRLLKADLEEMCDLVTIQKSGKDPCDYGLLLLKCVRLLCPLRVRKLPAGSAAFVGARSRGGYGEMKRRIERIAVFRGYRAGSVLFIAFVGLAVLAGGFWGIHNYSYARYTELKDVTVFDDTGANVIIEDSERLRQTVVFDEHRVVVDVEEMYRLLEESGSDTEGIYILFGGFMKQPGVGGGGEMVYTDLAQLTGERYEMEYETSLDALAWIVKML